MAIIDIEEANTNYELCKTCGGECCKRHACDCSPEDFGKDIKKMREAIESGNYSIDFSREGSDSFIMSRNETILSTKKVIESKKEFFYIRPKNSGRPTVDIVHEENDEGPCIFWSKEKGCSLSYEERPKGGRTLIPGLCMFPQYTRELMRIEWIPFTEELSKLAIEFFDSTWPLYKQLNLTIE